MQTTEITGLLEMLGISAEAIRSGPLKARPSPLEKLDDDAREAMQSMIADTHQMFLDMVRSRRGLSGSELAAVTDGRVFTGAQALSAKLIDALGGEDEARAWLSSEKGLSPELPVRDVGDRRGIEKIINRAAALGEKTIFSERLTLDGLVAVWHPGLR